MTALEPPEDWRLLLPESKRRWIRAWLWAVAATTFLVLVVGGVTRLTHSGLSMVDWQPLIVGGCWWWEASSRCKSSGAHSSPG